MKFNRSILSIALISALTACGGGSSSKTPDIETPTTPVPVPVPVKTVIAGKAIKGTIANAVVTVYKYVDGKAVKLEAADLETASIITEDDGSYTITILDYDGPIKVELSVDENTTMICDAPAGCAEVAYGQPIALSTVDPSLVLSAISSVGSANEGSANVNVSALTHLAAALIEADDNGVSAESIQTQSSVIANAFNIMGSLTELEPTAIESAASVAGEDNVDELRYGLINSGIMSALFSGEQTAEGLLSARLSEVVDDIVEHEGALLVNQDDNDEGFELSLVEVLDGAGEAAVAAAEAIAADAELSSQDNTGILGELEQQETNLENQSEYEIANEGEDGRSEPEVEVVTAGDAIAKAKAMVEDVRLFSHLFKIDTESNTGITNEGDKYIELIDSAGVMVEAEAASFLLLADLADALSEISMAYDAGTIEEGTFPIDSFLSIEGAVGSITIDEETSNGGMLFTISATSGEEKVALNAAVVFAENGLSLNLNLDGSIESAGAMLSLTEGSSIKVNLDSAVNREALENDSYEGEITSGELSLEVILEQKATDTITNPVAFTGMIKTKLMPVTSHVLDEVEDFVRDESGIIVRDENNNPVREFDHYKKSIETNILPEMLSLSGGFSSAQGNLIKATLTVNINDLDTYKAPEFKYIGAPVNNVVSINTSEDKNTLTITTAENVMDGFVISRTFEPGDTAGEWSSTSTVTLNEENSNRNDFVTYTTTRQNTVVDGMPALRFSYQSTSWAYIETVTPIDNNDDGIADQFRWDAFQGVTINASGELLYDDGSVHPMEQSDWGQTTWDSLEELFEGHRLQPESISNGAENFAFELNLYNGRDFSLTLDNESKVIIDLTDDIKETIADGSATALNAHVVADVPIKDVFTVTVSEDSSTVTATDDSWTRTFSIDYISPGNFTFNRNVNSNDNQGDNLAETRTVTTSDIGLDIEEVNILRHYRLDDHEFYQLVKVTPVDENNDEKADHFTRSFMHSQYINDDGVLTDQEGNTLTGTPYFAFESWDKANYSWHLPFNPFTTSNGLKAYKSWLENARGNYLSTYLEGVGEVEVMLTTEEVSSIVADSSNSFDAVNTHPDSDESLENEDVFLDVNAALSLEAILGDYQVNLMLSGNRTALDEGKFDLEMSYKLPDDENMRKFIAHMKTDEANRLTVNNSEGVLLILNESDDEASNVIGSIVVGSSATKVADIEDRNGVIWIVYTDKSEETM